METREPFFRLIKKLFFVISDYIFLILSYFIASYICLGDFWGFLEYSTFTFLLFFIFPTYKILIFYYYGYYSSLWKYAHFKELIELVWVITMTYIMDFIVLKIAGSKMSARVIFVAFLTSLLLISLSRTQSKIVLLFKNAYTKPSVSVKRMKRVLIVGGGEMGSLIIKELLSSQNKIPVAVIDDDYKKLHSKISGVPIVGNRNYIVEAAEKYNIDEIIIAIPSARSSDLKELANICTRTRCDVKIMPSFSELASQNKEVGIKSIRKVNPEDLLGRPEVSLDIEQISGYINNKVILVTGGGGSIGSELCRQLMRFKPRLVVVFDIYENNAYELQNELIHKYGPGVNLKVVIGSVRDKERLREVFSEYRPDIVYHAAAHKHVPLMEDSPSEAVKNNVFGTLYTAEISIETGVDKFVLISTDKAVKPTNIMGGTKRIAELIIQNLNQLGKTEFVAVRFGNVLGSNGSVIPLFKKQIEWGGPVTVTHPEITRFFMTIPEAAQLVIQASAMANGGEIFILDMGEPVKIAEFAEKFIRLCGFEPYIDIDIKYIGLRPGEKLHEELLLDEEGIERTKHDKIFVAKPITPDPAFIDTIKSMYPKLNDDRDEVAKLIGDIIGYELKSTGYEDEA